jgi:hypothetical protein
MPKHTVVENFLISYLVFISQQNYTLKGTYCHWRCRAVTVLFQKFWFSLQFTAIACVTVTSSCISCSLVNYY